MRVSTRGAAAERALRASRARSGASSGTTFRSEASSVGRGRRRVRSEGRRRRAASLPSAEESSADAVGCLQRVHARARATPRRARASPRRGARGRSGGVRLVVGGRRARRARRAGTRRGSGDAAFRVRVDDDARRPRRDVRGAFSRRSRARDANVSERADARARVARPDARAGTRDPRDRRAREGDGNSARATCADISPPAGAVPARARARPAAPRPGVRAPLPRARRSHARTRRGTRARVAVEPRARSVVRKTNHPSCPDGRRRIERSRGRDPGASAPPSVPPDRGRGRRDRPRGSTDRPKAKTRAPRNRNPIDQNFRQASPAGFRRREPVKTSRGATVLSGARSAHRATSKNVPPPCGAHPARRTHQRAR